jgi:hypothetical protein
MGKFTKASFELEIAKAGHPEVFALSFANTSMKTKTLRRDLARMQLCR